MSRRFRGRQNITIVEFFHHDFLSNTRLHDARQQRGCRLKFERVGRERQQGFAAAFQIEHRFTIEQDEAGTRLAPRTMPHGPSGLCAFARSLLRTAGCRRGREQAGDGRPRKRRAIGIRRVCSRQQNTLKYTEYFLGFCSLYSGILRGVGANISVGAHRIHRCRGGKLSRTQPLDKVSAPHQGTFLGSRIDAVQGRKAAGHILRGERAAREHTVPV